MRGVYRLYYILVFLYIHIFHPFRVMGKEKIPSAGPLLICANHSSAVDPVLLCYVLGFDHWPRIMAKKELGDIFILGRLIKAAGVFFVNRGSTDLSAVKTAMSVLKSGGEVMMFPEGTRISAEDNESAKTGAVMLASRTGARILPVYIPRDKRLFRRMTVVVGEPYEVPRLRGSSEVYGQYTRELMERINSLRAEIK